MLDNISTDDPVFPVGMGILDLLAQPWVRAATVVAATLLARSNAS